MCRGRVPLLNTDGRTNRQGIWGGERGTGCIEPSTLYFPCLPPIVAAPSIGLPTTSTSFIQPAKVSPFTRIITSNPQASGLNTLYTFSRSLARSLKLTLSNGECLWEETPTSGGASPISSITSLSQLSLRTESVLDLVLPHRPFRGLRITAVGDAFGDRFVLSCVRASPPSGSFRLIFGFVAAYIFRLRGVF